MNLNVQNIIFQILQIEGIYITALNLLEYMIQFAYEIDSTTDKALRDGSKCETLRYISHFLVLSLNIASIAISIIIVLLACCNIFHHKLNINTIKNIFLVLAQVAMYIIVNNLHRYEAIRYYLVKERLSNTIS